MIELRDIFKTYDKKTKHPIEALRGISMVLPDRGMVFVVGKSGGGKSTLLNILGGLDSYDSGDFLINGVSTKNFSSQNWDSYRNNYVGFVFQHHNLMPQYNVQENIGFALSLQAEDADDSKIDAALKAVDLEGYGGRNIKKLSGGQRQRVAIARALVKNYQMIVADEPTGNLDKATATEIFNLLKSISKTKLVVVVTHDVSAANAYADMAVAISNGKIAERAAQPEFEKVNDLALSSEACLPQNELPQNANQNQLQQCFMQEKQLQFQSSKLCPRAAMRIVKRTFKRHKVKLTLTIFVSVLAVLIFLAGFKYNTFNAVKVQAKAIGQESASVIGAIEYNLNKEGHNIKRQRSFSESDILELEKNFPQDPIYPIFALNCSLELYKDLKIFQKQYYTKSIVGICTIDSSGISSLGYTLLCGQYPSEQWKNTDILITKYMFDVIKFCGYISQSNDVIAINNYEDIIDKQIGINNLYTIKGVINTNIPDKIFEKVKAFANEDIAQTNAHKATAKKPNNFLSMYAEGYLTRANSVHRMIFTKPGAIEGQEMLYVLQKNNKQTNLKKAQFISDNNQRLQIEGEYGNTISFFEGITSSDTMVAIIVVLYVIGALLAFFLISNFISSGIQETHNEIGILRCVGASKKDIYKIYFIVAAILAASIFLITLLVFAFAWCPFLSIFEVQSFFYPFKIFTTNAYDIALLLAIIATPATLSAAIPLKKILKQTPIEILTNH